jgi:hypothetical protein
VLLFSIAAFVALTLEQVVDHWRQHNRNGGDHLHDVGVGKKRLHISPVLLARGAGLETTPKTHPTKEVFSHGMVIQILGCPSLMLRFSFY